MSQVPTYEPAPLESQEFKAMLAEYHADVARARELPTTLAGQILNPTAPLETGTFTAAEGYARDETPEEIAAKAAIIERLKGGFGRR
jgi:hypothetical protein